MAVDFENLKIREYIKRLLKSSTGNGYITESVLNWANEQKAVLGLPADAFETDSSVSREERLIKCREIVWKVVAQTQKSNRKTAASEVEKLIQSLGALFRLTQVEQEVFGLIVRANQYEYFYDLLSKIILRQTSQSNCEQLNFSDAIARLVGRSRQEISSVIKPQEKLLSCGLVELQDYRIKIDVSDKIKDIFSTGWRFSNQTELKNYLIGQCQSASLDWEDFAHLGKDRELLRQLMAGAIRTGSKGINILLHGKPGAGKTEFCRTLAHHLGVSLYAVAEKDKDGDEPNCGERLHGLRVVQEILSENSRACIMLDEAEDVFGSREDVFKTAPSKVFMNRQLEENPCPVFWITNDAASMDKALLRRMTYCLEFGELPFSVRMAMSQKECEKKKLPVSDDELQKFVREYDLPPAVFSNAVNVATLANGGFAEVRHVVAGAEKLLGVKRNSAKTPAQFDLFLINTDIDLTKVSAVILHGGRRDFSFCLSGPPGTGKSEFARWLAVQLDMDVMFKRASDLASKWLGETEQNIAAAFREAEVKEKLLIFDEADSFLHSRREAQRSWEVSHVNEMLTWMERHPLPFICTTNLAEKIDEAAFRRFTFKTRFDYLKKEQVAAAFRTFFGQESPESVLALDCLTPGDFAVVKKKIEYYGNATSGEIGLMLQQETLAKPIKLNSRRVGFKAG